MTPCVTQKVMGKSIHPRFFERDLRAGEAIDPRVVILET